MMIPGTFVGGSVKSVMLSGHIEPDSRWKVSLSLGVSFMHLFIAIIYTSNHVGEGPKENESIVLPQWI